MTRRLRTLGMMLLIILLAGAASARDWNVLDAGAKGDGQADCTAAFQQALSEAGAAGGGIVNVPAGNYAIKGNLSIPAGVTLQGTYRVPPNTPKRGALPLSGSRLLAYAGRGKQDGPPFVRLAGHAATLSGVIVSYPEWKQSDVPPVPYPPCVLADNAENVGIENCLLLNAYEGIRLVRAARHVVRGVYGYPSWRGLYVDECYDIGRVENCHFWPFGVSYKNDDPFCKWVNVNGISFEFARTDWEYVYNTFSFGYGVGYKFSATKAGAANGNFLGIGADSSRRPVLVEQVQPMGLLITNGEFVGRWGSADSVGAEIADEVAGKVSFVNCAFWGPLDRAIWAHGSAASQVTASACNFTEFDNTGAGSPAIQIDRGAAIVQGNTFAAHSGHLRVGPMVRSVIASGNQAPGGFFVRSEAGRRCQAFGNEANPVEWTAAARGHYRLRIGRTGDAPYLNGWHGGERSSDWPTTRSTMRWSAPKAQLHLPVNPGKACRLRLWVEVPGAAVSPDAGVYLGDKRIIAFEKAGALELTGELPAQAGEVADLAVRCRAWQPLKTIPGNRDPRELGVSLRAVELNAAESTAEKTFDANTGEWLATRGNQPQGLPSH